MAKQKPEHQVTPHCKVKLARVFVLQHAYEDADCGHDEVKFIGVYSTRCLAKAAVQRLLVQPGFREKPDCFCIDEYHLDKDHWIEGYS